MNARDAINARARTFFDELWQRGDPWDFEQSTYDQQKYQREIELLAGRPYERVLEIGCGAGVFTRQLATLAQSVVAIDVSTVAIEAARTYGSTNVTFKAVNVMEYDPGIDGPWDLIVMSETIYYLGWLYPLFDLAWLVRQLFESTRPGGRFLMANTCAGLDDYLLRPWVIDTYHDLIVNVGYRIEHRERFRGTKNGAELEAAIILFST